MLDKLKQLAELKKQAKDLKSNLAEEVVTGEALNGGIKIELDGNQEVKNVIISEEVFNKGDKAIIENGMIEAFRGAQKEVQKKLMGKIQSGQMNIPGMFN